MKLNLSKRNRIGFAAQRIKMIEMGEIKIENVVEIVKQMPTLESLKFLLYPRGLNIIGDRHLKVFENLKSLSINPVFGGT